MTDPGASGVEGPAEVPRLTPYELVFAEARFEEELFPAIQAEADTRGGDLDSPEGFVMLSTVGKLLRDLQPARIPGEAVSSAGALLEQYGALLFHAFHFWAADRRFYALEAAVLRGLLDHPPSIGDWLLRAPHGAGYIQLPRHLVWARVDEDTPPEPADGFFWTAVPVAAGDPLRRLNVLLTMGLRPGRPGLSVVPIAADVPPAGAQEWLTTAARPENGDFANVLPGGELQGWFSITTPLEVLKLVCLCFWYIATHPGAVVPVEPTTAGAGASPHTLPPSRLAARRVGLAVGGPGAA